MKADFETNFRDAEIARLQKLLRLFNAPRDEILMRRALKRAVKESQKMIRREASLLRDLLKLQGQVIAIIHVGAREMQAAIDFGVERFGISHAL